MQRRTALAVLLCTAAPAWAETTWDSLSYDIYGDRALQNGESLIFIDAPYRSPNDARTDISAFVTAPKGLKLGAVSLVLDENPMPVSAVFEMTQPQSSFFFDVTMRVNGPTPVHVVAETTDGQLFVAETFVKTSGLGACSAPPGTDLEEALATLGQMELQVAGAIPVTTARLRNGALSQQVVDLTIDHPSHSGMQKDQISLLYIPMRYVGDVEIDLDGGDYVDITGSISLSENPRVSLSIPSATRSVDVTMTDTSGTVSHLRKDLAGF